MRHLLGLLLLPLLAVPAAGRERPAMLVRLPEPAGLGRLLLPPEGRTGPLAVLLPDALGDDGRAEPYAEALSARGIASLTLGLAGDADGPGVAGMDPAAAPAAVPVALAWAEAAGFDPGRIALVGFGAGGRAVLAAAAGRPGVALYPGCRGLPRPAAPAWLLVGEDAPDAAACAGFDAPPGVALRLLPGLGHGWDVPAAGEVLLLPDPAGDTRLRAQVDLPGAIAVADLVAATIEGAFGARQAVAR
ncbi:hypothetical protein [Falsiroseomonas sp. CW058]|uniref:hypothetical protein n=1 Tax=Falsiroseomonas sp. CW058 TaxID=3388664 RepID=UPI003D320D77